MSENRGNNEMNDEKTSPRFNMGDGKFGAAYAQEDGVAFMEESTGNNERIGEINVDIKKEE